MSGPDMPGIILVTHRDRCSGHARCNAIAPSLFVLDERGYTDLPPEHALAAELVVAARRGAAECPERVFEVKGTAHNARDGD